jgi:adenosylhomocysteine nucleosidase
MMRVLVLAPMESELRPLVRRVGARADRAVPGRPALWRAQIGPTELVATRIGMGPDTAARATEGWLDHLPVDHVIVMGVAGGLSDTARIGSLVVPAAVVDAETGTEYRPPRPLLSEVAGRVVTTATVILDEQVQRRWAAAGFDAVDMESAGVAAVCSARGVPWTVVRAISDRPDQGLVDGAVVALTGPDGTADLGAAARLVLRRPGRIPGLIALGRGLRAATTAATDAVVRACTNPAA